MAALALVGPQGLRGLQESEGVRAPLGRRACLETTEYQGTLGRRGPLDCRVSRAELEPLAATALMEPRGGKAQWA